MTTQQWDKIYAYVVEAYPAWKPSLQTSLIWFSELKNYEFNDVGSAFRRQGIKAQSQYPPSLFQILAELELVGAVPKFNSTRITNEFFKIS